MPTSIPSHLSDPDLVTAVARLATAERDATASLIAHLAELYGRRLHERAGFSSLFTFCTEALRLSESEAYDRMKAAKVVRRYPAVLGMLASGAVTLTTIRLLAPHLTTANHQELFAAASGMGKRQVQELLAQRFPEPDVCFSVRRLSDPNGVFTPAPPPLMRPLSPDRYQITFTATGETRGNLELAQDLLRHALPSGDPAQIFARALEVLVEELVKQKYAANRVPRSGQGTADDSRHIPAEVKRAVFIRDHGRCAFVGSHGRTCGERAFVEFHHLVPFAAGGRSTVDNIQLRCRAHNSYEAEMFYGPARQYVSDGVAPQPAETGNRVTPDAFSFRNESPPPGTRLPVT
jgi:5-methylcytosine-specific restriction endonuclease McrA